MPPANLHANKNAGKVNSNPRLRTIDDRELDKASPETLFDSRVKSRFPYWESDFKMRKTAFTNTYDAGVLFGW